MDGIPIVIQNSNASLGKWAARDCRRVPQYNAIQGDKYSRGKAFVDIKLGSSDCQVGCRGATVMGGTYNEMFNTPFSATTRVTLYKFAVPDILED